MRLRARRSWSFRVRHFPLPPGKPGHEPGSVLDRVVSNLHWRDEREDADPEQPVGLGLLPQWLARHAKSELDLPEGSTFNPNLLYEMVYTAKNPLVLGVGFAAFRDLASFLRYGSVAPGGGSNPIAGTVSKALTVGGSQSAAFLHGFIFWGFNEEGRDNSGHNQKGRIVFDGAWPQIDGRMMVMNIRWGQPNNLMYLYMGGDEAPVWWADYPNLARSLPPNGMLHRCAKNDTCPEILETFGFGGALFGKDVGLALRLHLRKRHTVAFECSSVLLARRDPRRRHGQLQLDFPRRDRHTVRSVAYPTIQFRWRLPTVPCSMLSFSCS